MDEAFANLHTATIGKVTAVNEKTVNVKPMVMRVVDGVPTELPEFLDVPPVFLRGGASYEAMPITVGDYALLIFTERCFDSWYSGKGMQPPADYRMHDYSDGFAVIGISPLGSAITIPNKVRRNGDAYITGDYEHEGDYVITGNVTINGTLSVTGDGDAGDVNITGRNLRLTGGEISADTIDLKQHVHNGVQPGGGNTGNPVP